MDAELQKWIRGSFEEASRELGQLAIRMNKTSFKFSSNYREYEYLKMILVDHIDALADELTSATARRDWSEIPGLLSQMSKIFEIYKKALTATRKK